MTTTLLLVSLTYTYPSCCAWGTYAEASGPGAAPPDGAATVTGTGPAGAPLDSFPAGPSFLGFGGGGSGLPAVMWSLFSGSKRMVLRRTYPTPWQALQVDRRILPREWPRRAR